MHNIGKQEGAFTCVCARVCACAESEGDNRLMNEYKALDQPGCAYSQGVFTRNESDISTYSGKKKKSEIFMHLDYLKKKEKH